MNNEDFERLKAKLGDEFEIIQDALVSIDGTIAFVRKKDIWKGVEFAECVAFSDAHGKTNGLLTFGKIYRVSNIVFGSTDCHIINDDGYEGNCMLNLLNPSTEQAYIEQLKKEAHERFGEIRHGDKFKNIKGSIVTIENCWGEFEYVKDRDLLCFGGCYIYEQGKWAERVKERVKVNSVDLYIEVSSGGPYLIKPEFSIINVKEYDKNGVMNFLASQLEKYLNGEIE